MKFIFIPILLLFIFGTSLSSSAFPVPTDKGTLNVQISTSPQNPILNENSKLIIDFINPKNNRIQEHIDYRVTVLKEGSNIFGPIQLTHTSTGSVRIPVHFPEVGTYAVLVEVEGILFQPIPMETVSFNLIIGKASAQPINEQTPTGEDGGGCLIATATFGSELAHQVQKLRELRDNSLMKTTSGSTFLTGFSQIYYSFSPTIADWERQNPVFKEGVKLAIAPLLTTLSFLNYVDMDSEAEVLGYGISLILLNIGMYFIAPAFVIWQVKKRF